MRELIDLAPGMRVQILIERVRRFAESQEGVVSRQQLAACGLSGGDITRWISQGRLIRILPGVYALGHTRISWRARCFAALLFAGPHGALSHATAAVFWQLIEARADTIDVSSPRQRQDAGFVCVHRRRQMEWVEIDGFRLTTPARTLIDIAPGRTQPELRKILARADYRGLLAADDLRALMGRGVRGAGALRVAIDRHMPELARTLSPLEDRLLFLCERRGIPLPEPNVWVEGFLVDALWRDAMLIVEVDGRANHSSPSQRRRDRERDDALRAAGYAVLRFRWSEVVHEPSRVAEEIRAGLNRK